MLLRSTLFYAPAIMLTRLSALLMLVIATRLIDQTEYGLLTLVVTVGELTDSAVSGWLRIALLRLGGKGEISMGSVKLAARVLVVTTLLGLVVSAAGSALVAPERWADFTIAVGTYLAVGALSRFALTLLQMQQRHSAYSLLEFLRAVLQLLLAVAAIFLIQNSFLAMSLASSLGVLIAGGIALALASRRVVRGPSRFTHRELFALGIPLVAAAIVSFGLNSAERVLLKLYYDAGAVAVFAAVYALARQPIDTIANAINIGAFPEMVNKFDTEGSAAAGRFLSHQMALMARLTFPIVALLIALSTEIGGVLLPPDYRRGLATLFPIIALSVLFANFSTFVFENVFHAHKKPWLQMVALAPGSVATIGLSLLLIPAYAEIGAALALCGGTLVGLGAASMISHRLTPVPIPWADLALSLGVAVTTGLAAWTASALFGEAWPLFKLAVGGIAGCLVFLGLLSLLYPNATLTLAGKVRAKLGTA
ncbi:MAG: polysaccharide biosynthesis C-terminal domain-containing protein [Devosia sp.]|nr:polysaccharide biosynthesis C-terminal domain-containing protein [Devosia sp.]